MSSAAPRFVLLPDRRKLAWAEYGDPDGRPVLYLHGGPGSRVPVVPDQNETATAAGIRLVCVERPGFGESTRHPERTLLDWADDVAIFTAALGMGRFSVIGYSAGGPHALVCAARLADRVTRAVAVGCGVPWDLPELAAQMDWPRRMLRLLAQRAPWLLRLTYRSLPDPRTHPEKLTRKLLAGLPPPDREVLARPEIFRLGVEHTAAGLQHGFDGMADEVCLLASPWGFDLKDLAVPVTLWCGTEDTAAPLGQAEYLAGHIPDAELRRIQGEGHLCLFDHWTEILASARA